ncbi:hepatocyte growth factor activator, partial [Trichomycterus rosablanca]|uniref:hepatocyte growth factor activator n=1 Tax=Trichomycterus rosablanca TaxID=2290929 RepID=UPI002F35F52B
WKCSSPHEQKHPPGFEVITSTLSDTVPQVQKVLTTDGRECKFPFRLGGTLYHQCISVNSGRKWCSLTHNFDRDMKWGYCASRSRLFNSFLHNLSDLNLCKPNPCRNGGVCTAVPYRQSFECVCPNPFTGNKCELNKCYEPLHLRYYNIGESWGRIDQHIVEQCKCLRDGLYCERARYTACRTNPCQNDGTCRLIEATGEEVCACRPKYSGPDCSISLAERCYEDTGVHYRGTANTTISGALCLPWNSDMMYNELTVDTVNGALLKGLGDHAFCRNPDNDKKPWCYKMNDGVISWQYCNVPSCSKGSETPTSSKTSSTFSTRNSSPTPKPVPKPNCGQRQLKRISRGRILGGTSAMPGSHPWMAALYIGEEFCAGSLVASCWVVSAAHCFLRNPLPSTVRVVLGQQVVNDTGPNTRTFGIEKYMTHPQHNQFSPTVHDIVLVKLKKVDGRCTRKTKFIRQICLPDKLMTFPDYTCCTITGWGHMQEKGDSYSTLTEGIVKLIPYERCSSPEVYGSEVRPGMLCAGSDTCVDACQGDSGGPLACVQNDVSFLYGIISWGDGCGRTGKPGVYTRVTEYVSWINQVIKRSKPSRRKGLFYV